MWIQSAAVSFAVYQVHRQIYHRLANRGFIIAVNFGKNDVAVKPRKEGTCKVRIPFKGDC